MPDILQWILAAGFAVVLAGLARVAALRLRERRVIGKPVHATLARKLPRRVMCASALVLVLFGFQRELAVALPCVLLLAGAVALLILTPSVRDRVCGERGVRSGWEVLSFAEFAEWRLTGDHLRFRGGEEWTAVDLPRPLQEPVRARIEEACRERESRFQR